MGKPSPQPFTDTEADLASERHEAVQRYKMALAERVRRLPPGDDRQGRAGREEVRAELAAVWAKATEAWPGDDSHLRSNFAANFAASWAEVTPALPKAAAVMAISLASFIALVAVSSATAPTSWHGGSREIMASFHGTALVSERYDNGPPHLRLRGDVCGPPPDYGGCFP